MTQLQHVTVNTYETCGTEEKLVNQLKHGKLCHALPHKLYQEDPKLTVNGYLSAATNPFHDAVMKH